MKLLARATEEEARAGTPDEVRAATVAAEPLAIAIVPHVEQPEVAARVGNRLHGNNEPLSLGLVCVLQTQLGANLIGAELQSELLGSGVDLLAGGSLAEAEVFDRDDHEVEFGLLGGRREGGFAEDVIGPVADLHSLGLDGLAEGVGILDAGAEADGLPDRQIAVGWLDDQPTRQEKTHSFVATELVKNCLYLSQRPIVVLHDMVLSPAYSWKNCLCPRLRGLTVVVIAKKYQLTY